MARDSREVLARPAPPPDRTLRYGSHPDHVVDVRLPPPGSPPGGLVLFLHGGFWRQEYDRTHTGPLAAALAAAGHVVATAEYRRTGGAGGWPATLEDVKAVVARMPSMLRDELGAVGPVVLGGHSAGGQLALWAGAARAATEHVRSVVALAPVADLRLAHQLDLDAGAVRELLGGGPDDVPDRFACADPVSRVPLGIPVQIVHGTRDTQVPVELSYRFVAAARAAGDAVQAVYPAADHFALIDPYADAWADVVSAFGRALATSV